MPARSRKRALARRWIHSHEEDTAHEVVFRPSNYTFPLSRGRSGFDLKPDGAVLEITTGPTDQPQETEGHWEVDDDARLHFYPKSSSTPGRTLEIVSVDKNRLIVKKQ